MKIAVTGASGLIGANVAACAASRGHEVTGVTRETSDAESLESLGVRIARSDIRGARDQLRRSFEGSEVVIHTAATFSYHEPADRLYEIAVAGSENVLRAAAEVGAGRVVLTSSSVVFGYRKRPELIGDQQPLCDPSDEPPYVAAKVAQDFAALELAAELELELVFACPTVTVGPTKSALGPSNSMILAYLNDELRSTYPGGCNIVSARDVGAAHVLLAEAGSPNEHYLVGSENLLWSDLHAEIGRLTGVGPPRVELSPSLAWAAAYFEEVRAKLGARSPLSTRAQASMLGRYYWYDDSRVRALGYEPMPASRALLETISWLVASSHVSRELRAHILLAPEVQRYRFEDLAA